MGKNRIILLLVFILSAVLIAYGIKERSYDDTIISFISDPKSQNIKLYWKNDKGRILKSIQHLKNYVEAKQSRLLFAMNGGMFTAQHMPLGLYIQEQKILAPINKANGTGNFYMKPNGVFYITIDNKAGISPTEAFVNNGKIKYATQSGPMLVIDGKIHSAFKEGSVNLNIRNGVGILPDGRVVFAMSKEEINFYDFASYFLKLGCKDALYLDGFVSRTYLPEKNWVQTDGEFGVMIGVTE